ncbi:ABC transporter substrate-binding protein [Phytohabitans suffuscus]|uniref:Peptide ABC transporter permease n=1 Tax=Phytohabitans suffuscus TaxID=624315 RepID=A0A6F8YFL7_9ACTN|nr:ABC transporter substrate-binding protein [Phytohabitans suffuscus]BCB84768.1 peptide ABC transporter permease [Phytohabitans suffuscus]
MEHRQRGPFVTTGVVTLGLLAALGACSSGGDPVASGEVATPRSGGALTFAVLSDPGCADPQQVTSLDAGYWARQVVDSLTDQNPQTGEIVPWLAESWQVSGDATAFTFVLRSGATFSDGSPVDAAAVKRNFDTLVDLGARASTGIGYLRGYKGSEVLDGNRVVVRFESPNAQFLQATSTFQLGIVAPASLDRSADERCAGVLGSGPFVLERYAEGEGVDLTRRAGYAWASTLWDNGGEAYLESARFRVVGESSVRTGGLQSGEFDAAAGVSVQDAGTLTANGANLVVKTNGGIGFQLAARNDAPIISELPVRQALSLAIDREEIASVNYVSGTKAATSIVSSATPAHADLGSQLRHAPDEAKRVLDAAGWTAGADGIRVKDGKRLVVRAVWTNGAVGNKTLLELVQQYAREVGIDLTLVEQDQATFVESLGSGAFDVILTTVTRADGDVLRNTFSTKLTNQFHVPAGGLDDLLDAQAAEPDPAKRAELLAQAQREIVDNLYGIPLVELTTVVGVSPKVHGVSLDASSRLRLHDVWKDQ